MGPSVKFLSRIISSFSKKGGFGIWQKTTLFPGFFSDPFPYQQQYIKSLWPMMRVTVCDTVTESPTIVTESSLPTVRQWSNKGDDANSSTTQFTILRNSS